MKNRFNSIFAALLAFAASPSVRAAENNAAPKTQEPPQSANPQDLDKSSDAGVLKADAFNDAKLTDSSAKYSINPAILRAEVLLDRSHNSPGVIDGRDGANFEHALAAYEKSHDLKVTKALGSEVWSSLTSGSDAPVVTKYTLTDKDVAGPFYPDLPKDYGELAKLKEIGYRSPSQKIAALFHMSETLLQTLNPNADLSKSGTEILVTNIAAGPIKGSIKKIAVNKTTGQVIGYDAHGDALVSYPATIGSQELPSPSGTYKIKGVAFNPIYYYDPDKNSPRQQ
jgi:peptidoglycan hydrolase-like protein with peptidoglycan-binding domain